MKVILKKAVENLGELGDVVTVKPGFARNYLLPHGLAYEASETNLARIEEDRRKAEEFRRRDYLEARRRASQIEGTSLTFEARASDEGKLFGSISAADVVERLNGMDFDFEVERGHVLLEEPIKAIGSFVVPVRLHAEVEFEIELKVERLED
jgi:large subunit ribosomal protein L9